MILVIDNYDSFVHNVGRYFSVLGAQVEIVRNDAITIDEIDRLRPQAIVISPGPCTPAEAGISCASIETFSGRIPLLGVCLGHQCLGVVHGGRIAQAQRPLHGQSSAVDHDGKGLFQNLPNPLQVGRYHSLIVEETPVMRKDLSVVGRSEEGEIMALSHRTHPTWGVQFHPESVLTPHGERLFANFLRLADAWTVDAVA